MQIILTRHAIERCVEMGVQPDRIEAILTNYSIRRPSGKGYIYVSEIDATIAVIVAPDETPDTKVIMTVVPRTYDRYERG